VSKQSGLLNADAAGKIIGISGRRVRILIEDGVIPATRVGNTYIIKRSDLAKVGGRNRKPGRPKKNG
jgi:excisionase family DNA binding protein